MSCRLNFSVKMSGRQIVCNHLPQRQGKNLVSSKKVLTFASSNITECPKTGGIYHNYHIPHSNTATVIV